MKYKKFQIANFKGIKLITFDLSKGKGSSVYTLVGLNESGKTTVLQAMAFFYEQIMQSSSDFEKYDNSLHSSGIRNLTELIPKDRDSDFTDRVSVKATVELDQSDADRLTRIFEEFKFKCTRPYSMSFEIHLSAHFRDSKPISAKPSIEFGLDAVGKIGRGQREVEFSSDKDRKASLDNFIARMLPSIIYYPNFLLEFPDQIQLEQSVNEDAPQAFYRRFLQDILDSFDGNYTLQKSIIRKSRSADRQDAKAMQQTLRKMAIQIEKTVFRSDFKMLSNTSKNKHIDVSEPKESEKEDLTPEGQKFHPLMLEIAIEDGANRFTVNERSLGFGWLFAFLLITHFRLQRKHSSMPIFVFDEPASNLHSTYQMALLKAIEDLVSDDKALVIYSTHSHYMINPKWLGAAYIVQNNASNYEDHDPFSRPPTDIGIETYRSFAVHHPDQRTYFQPILDVLEYRPSNIEMLSNAVIVEGKSDFYFFEVFRKILQRDSFATLPGTGSSNMRPLASLYLGWAKPMLIILDSDAEGKAMKTSYLEDYGSIIENKIFTLLDVDPTWDNMEIEDLISDDDVNGLKEMTNYEGKKMSKKAIANAIEFALVSNSSFHISDKARSNYTKIFDFIDDKLASQANA